MRNIKHIQLKDMEEIGEDDEEFEIDGDGEIRPRSKKEFSDQSSSNDKSNLRKIYDYITATNTRKALLIISICSFFILFTIIVSVTTKAQILYSNIRLPANVKPIHYLAHVEIRMEPYFNFNGTIVSTLNITNDKSNNVDYIVIHADESTLSLNSINLVQVVNNNTNTNNNTNQIEYVNSTEFDEKIALQPTSKYYNAEKSYYILYFKDLKKLIDKNGNIFNLYISYNGSLIDPIEGTSTLRGIYLSSYKNPSNHSDIKYLAVSQFEPVDARLSFPCFDEPNLKARWTIWLTHSDSYSSLSNMNSVITVTEDSKSFTKFETTPPMSSYLVCIVVSQFDHITGSMTRSDGTMVDVSIWAAPHLMNTVDFALDMAKRSLEFFEDYFGIQYPLPKMDLVGIPDFAAGAMENWGLLTFREADLLYSPITSDQENKQRIADTISHEIAHQWFGDLVTMDWWNDLWLNEGFATFMSFKCQSVTLADTFNGWELFQYSARQPGLDVDASPFTHTISNNYTDPIDIMASFDSVTYDKGSSILLMLESMVDSKVDNAFRTGVRNYLAKYKYSNAKTNDLWEMMFDAIGNDHEMNIPEIMNEWTGLPGFPKLYVESISGGKDKSTSSFRISQQKFIQPNTTLPVDFKSDSIWWIPVNIKDSCNNSDHLSLSTKAITYTSTANANCGTPNDQNYIIANYDATGFYRTIYDQTTFDIIVGKLRENATHHFSTFQRINFADDLYAFSKIGLIKTHEALKTFNYTTHSDETNFVVWKDILSFLSFAHNRLENAPCFIEFIKKAQYIFNHGLLKQIQLEIDHTNNNLSYNDLELRKIAFSKVNSLSISSLRNYLYKVYLNNSDTPEKIDPSIRGPLYSSIVLNGDIEEYEWVISRFENTISINERIDALKAISNPKNPQLIQNTLRMLLNGKIKNQDFYMVFLEMSFSPFARELAWNFLLDNFKYVQENTTPGDIGKFVYYFASSMDSQSKIDKIKSFFDERHPIPTSSFTNAIASIQYNMNWLKNQAPQLCEWIENN